MEVNLKDVGGSRAEKVLVVDDNRTNKAMLRDLLCANGYEVKSAADGREGLELIKSWTPAVVLLDILMPGLSGISVCREIRKLELERRPSIIVVSVKDDKGTIVDALTKDKRVLQGDRRG
jgi:CheY-like chemotaxis protein